MFEYKFDEKAYAKMIFHAAKYPHLAVNGILLAEKKSSSDSSSNSGAINIVDAIPLFHQCLYVTPMAEVALMQIDAYAERSNLVIMGYYAAAENFHESLIIEKVPALRIADKIQENSKNACLTLIDNKLMTLNHNQPAIKVYANVAGEGGRCNWSRAPFNLQQKQTTLEAVSALLKRGAMKDVIDFDNHLDNPVNDWTNGYLDVGLQKVMAMY